MAFKPRHAAVLALLALVPLVIYATLGGEPGIIAAAITAFNICLIATALFLGFGPAPGDSAGHGDSPAS